MTMYTPTILALRVTNFVLTLTGVFATCFRLWRRKTTTHIWWDDIWAALTMVFGIICMTSMELFLQNQTSHTLRTKIALYYLMAQSYIALNWAARISILFTVIRISVGRVRYCLKWIAAIFILTWLILTAQLLWTCEGKNADWGPSHLMCVMPLRVAIVQLTTDALSDFILIVAPLCLVWKIKLSRTQRIRIITIFSSTIAMTIVSLNHACWLIVDGGGLSEAMAGLIQNSVSLLVCNFSVIIAFIFQIAAEDARSSYHLEAGTLSFRCKVPSGVPSGTCVRIERSEVITLDSVGSLHGDTTKIGQLLTQIGRTF
ncbi:hypothetical protein K443DRAFT_132581 [Laccaria amethystina LaAM-08-1]|uniref:Rhodopsin domain-containing protein n=1 Tax=Laccaria amethystina LaAM-08-1 TaxID=1095629 RepID=A0A0C9XXU3_9AGAR|nr:hypothetical protein K443DRAFT_132581 [Laccaria amethystina LaAM-08-1]